MYRINFYGNRKSDYGNRKSDLTQIRTQPGQAEVCKVEMDPSGQWLVTTCAESGQITFVRIRPETTTITLDVEERHT